MTWPKIPYLTNNPPEKGRIIKICKDSVEVKREKLKRAYAIVRSWSEPKPLDD